MKTIGLLKIDVFKIVTPKEFIISNKVSISNKFITSEKIPSNIQKYNFHLVNKIKDLYIYLILKLLLSSSILFNYIAKVIKLLYNVSIVSITRLFTYYPYYKKNPQNNKVCI